MEEKNIEVNIHSSWKFPEVVSYNRTKRWYYIAGVFWLFCFGYAILTGNFMFAGIMVMGSFVYFYSQSEASKDIVFNITEEGIEVGRHSYLYKELSAFWIVYEPSENVKTLYFDFKNKLYTSLSVPLMGQNPLSVREILLRYLPEDLQKEEEPMSDIFNRAIKL